MSGLSIAEERVEALVKLFQREKERTKIRSRAGRRTAGTSAAVKKRQEQPPVDCLTITFQRNPSAETSLPPTFGPPVYASVLCPISLQHSLRRLLLRFPSYYRSFSIDDLKSRNVGNVYSSAACTYQVASSPVAIRFVLWPA